MIGAIAGDIIGSRFEGHPGPPAGFELFDDDCRFTGDPVGTMPVAAARATGAGSAPTLRASVRRYLARSCVLDHADRPELAINPPIPFEEEKVPLGHVARALPRAAARLG